MNCANHPERERIAFCQNCGKPLCQECARVVGSAVFCEPCLEARISGSSTNPYAGAVPPVPPASAVPPPVSNGEPNPGLAALLGFIPGVGAMYNGQYSKGIVHLIVFAVLVSLADEHGIFGLFVTGWIFYQVFEAYQTAKARRDETPLPNPFGLNDLGDRLGFGRNWTAAPPAGAPVVPPVYPAPEAAAQSTAYQPPVAGPPPAGTGWGNPAENFVGSPYNPPYIPTPYPPSVPGFDASGSYPRNRFPTGAIWLIGLGAIFLFGNMGIFHGFPVHRLFPFFLIGLGVWLFVHRMTATGATLADDGTAFYRIRLLAALRGSIWVVLVGIMFLLSSFHILSWGSSWPLFIIVAGVMILAEKTIYNPADAPPAYPVPPVPPAYPAPPAPSQSGPDAASFSDQDQSSQEGR
ncbi:hypothetical protein GWR55_11105 [Edaphobacter sp. 12200R-103]|nr:hypothetical protein GWR55_11105 [Edaphobacter sp. 12200R-103]